MTESTVREGLAILLAALQSQPGTLGNKTNWQLWHGWCTQNHAAIADALCARYGVAGVTLPASSSVGPL